MENHLTESTEKLDVVLDDLEEGVIIEDSNGVILTVNKLAEELLGIPEYKLTGKRFHEIDLGLLKEDGSLMTTDDFPDVITLKTKSPRKRVKFGVPKSNGEVTWLCAYSKLRQKNDMKYVLISFFDITDVFVLKQKFETANNDLNTLIQSLDDIVFEMDRMGNYLNVWVSDESKLFVPKDKFLGKNIKNLFPKGYVNKVLRTISKTLNTGNVQEVELGNPLAHDSNQCFLSTFRPIRGSKNRVIISVTDITERKRNMEKIRGLEKRLLLAARAGEIGLGELNLDTMEMMWDDNMHIIYGTDKNKFAANFNFLLERVHPDDRSKIEQEVAMSRYSDHEIHVEFRIIRPSGELRYLRAVAKVEKNKDGKPVKLFGANYDITDIRKTEIALQESEEKFRKTFINSSIGIALMGLDGQWLEVNPAVTKIVGYSKEELFKMNFQDITHPDDLETDLKHARRLSKGEIDSYQIEKRYIHKDGSIIWVLLSVTLVHNDDGSPKFAISQIIDITNTKELITRLKGKNEVLAATSKDLENKVAQLENFSYIISHNLKGPASNINDLIREVWKTDSVKEQKKLFQMLEITGKSIIETLQDLEKVVSVYTQRDVSLERCSFDDTIRKIEKQLFNQIRNKNAKIVKKLDAKYVDFPRVYLESILYNLMNNALKYSSPDRTPVIEIETKQDDRGIVLCCGDNGIGIDLKRFGKDIFKYKRTFHQGYESTGIGLFLVKTQVESFGGEVSVQSEPEKGSRFTIEFRKPVATIT